MAEGMQSGDAFPLLTSTPPGHKLHRAHTIDENSARRRRPTLGNGSAPNNDEPFAARMTRRRSSLFSDDARRILNPEPDDVDDRPVVAEHETSHWEALPILFALLPAVAGVLFQGGSAVATDLILLTFGGLFLYWTVTQPWLASPGLRWSPCKDIAANIVKVVVLVSAASARC